MEKVDFVIPINGLTPGRTKFEWRVGKEFFVSFGNTEIIDADVLVSVEAEKATGYIGVDCDADGVLTVACDRCLADLEIQVCLSFKLSLKYEVQSDEDANDGDREVICLPPDNTDFDMSQIIYDYLCLSLPIQRFHKDGECDCEVADRIGEDNGTDEASAENNPFAALKGLFDN